MITLSNTGKTITFGMNMDTVKEIFPTGYAMLAYNQKYRTLHVIASDKGGRRTYKIKQDRSSSHRAYLTLNTKYGPKRLPEFGRLSFDNFGLVTNHKKENIGIAITLPDDLPFPKPLEPHEREMKTKEIISNTEPEQEPEAVENLPVPIQPSVEKSFRELFCEVMGKIPLGDICNGPSYMDDLFNLYRMACKPD